MKRNVWAGPGVRGWRQVVRVRLTCDFEDAERHLLGHFRAACEPFRICPRFDHLLGVEVALLHLLFHVVIRIKHKDHSAKAGDCCLCQFLFQIQSFNQRCNVVATLHPPEHLHRVCFGDKRRRNFAVNNVTQKVCLHMTGVVHTRVHSVSEKVVVKCSVRWCLLEHLDHALSLAGVQGQRRNALCGTLRYMSLVGSLECLGLHGRKGAHLVNAHTARQCLGRRIPYCTHHGSLTGKDRCRGRKQIRS
mmetsp:Transcript_21201/g.50418  ORF Transcript_21201/g.50418 Transcript_21201/m.50418 type:complete len:247 (-) Transcript_21201:4-744(-)